MLGDVLHRIDQRLAKLGLSETAASKAAGRGATLIKDMRRATRGKKATSGTKVETLQALAPVLGTNFLWLATGEGDPENMHDHRARRSLPVMGRVGAGAVVDLPEDLSTAEALDYIDIEIDGDFIAEVVGDSMWPRWLDGERVIIEAEPSPPDRLLNGYAVVQIEDEGRRYLKLLRRGSRVGLFTLESHNAAPIENVAILCAWRVKASWYG
jgi:phage repressor protein C with HTH and peptisase S24 domain